MNSIIGRKYTSLFGTELVMATVHETYTSIDGVVMVSYTFIGPRRGGAGSASMVGFLKSWKAV